MGGKELLQLLVGSPGWRWMAVVGTSVLVALLPEFMVRKVISGRLAGAAAIVTGALGATVVGYLLFPPIMISSPESSTLSLVGAVVAAAYWLMLQVVLCKSSELRPPDHFQVCRVPVICGTAAGALTGLLSGTLFGLLFSIPLGLLGGIFLAVPYFLMALLMARRQRHETDGTQRK